MMNLLIFIALIALLWVLCWPLAVLVLCLGSMCWVLSIPFRIVGALIHALWCPIKAILLFPARLLGYR